MAQSSFGWKGTVNELQWAQLAALMGHGSGLAKLGDCAISQVTGQRAVSVAAGGIFGDGILTTLSSAETVTLPAPTNGQWFLLVLNRVWSTKATTLTLRNSSVTATAAPGNVPASYPASFATGVGSNSDTAVAWLWGNSSGTAVTVVPILRAPTSIQPRRGTAAQRDALYGAPAAPAAQNYLQGAEWFNTETVLMERYFGAYDASLNPRGLDSASWQSQPTRRTAVFKGNYPNTGSVSSTQNLRGLVKDQTASANGQFATATANGVSLSERGTYTVVGFEDMGAFGTARSALLILAGGIEIARVPIPAAEAGGSTAAIVHVPTDTPVELTFQTVKQTGGASTVTLAVTIQKTT